MNRCQFRLIRLKRAPRSVPGKALYLLCLGSAVCIFTFLWSEHWTKSRKTTNQDIGSTAVEPLNGPTVSYRDTNEEQLTIDHESQANCQKKHCSEYLSQKERETQRRCMREVFRHMDPFDIKKALKENNCRFIDGRERHPVALVSAEGSGNTWIRGLLERVTGVCTGFIHCDYVMRQSGFIGEGIKSGSVLVVKTHAVEPQWSGMSYSSPKPKQPFFGSAILIVRNPYRSLVAEWNRRVTNLFLIPNGIEHNESHTNTVPKEYWSISEWNSYVYEYIEAWKERILSWLLQDHAKVLVVRYEDVKRNTLREVSKMLQFLEVDYVSEEEVEKKLSEDFTEFKRPQRKQGEFEHYTNKQKHYIRSVILETVRLLRKKGKIINLENYHHT